jgi:hypothetical protein
VRLDVLDPLALHRRQLPLDVVDQHGQFVVHVSMRAHQVFVVFPRPRNLGILDGVGISGIPEANSLP